MAIINSMGVGKARGSMGNVTYRTVRGRTIGSQKRGGVDPATRADGETLVQFIFGLMARFVALHAADIKASFDGTKYGSARNAFIKLNYSAFARALKDLYQTGLKNTDISDSEMESAITAYATEHPDEIYRVKKDGEVVYLSGAWTSEDNPEEGGSAKVTVSNLLVGGSALASNGSMKLGTEKTTSFSADVASQNVLSLAAGSVVVQIGDNAALQCSNEAIADGKLTAEIPSVTNAVAGSGQTVVVTMRFQADDKESTKVLTFTGVNVTTAGNPL